MARKHYWQFLVTDEGNPIENASISIYEAGSENPVWVYTDEIGGTGTSSDPQVTTSKKGYFEFWVATDNEVNGYPIGTKFKLAWSAPGVSGGYIDYIDVFSTAVEPVLLGDSNPDRNKAVSNALATGWEDHKNWDVTIQGHPIHGIYGVDIGDTDTTLSKLVSNAYAKRWTEHESTDYTGFTDTFAPPTNPHGIEQGDATFLSTDVTINKLVANSWIKNWEDHRNDVLGDPHPQYSLIDGTKDYTGAVGYSNGILATVNNFSTETDHTPNTYPNVALGSGGAHQAYGTVTVGIGGNITNIVVTDGGLGYHVPEQLTILAAEIGGGTNATCDVATITDTVNLANLRGNDFITESYIRNTEAYAIAGVVGSGNDGTMGPDGAYYYSLTDNLDGTYSFTFTHNIGVVYPIVTVWRNLGVNTGEVVQPLSIISNSGTETTFTFTQNSTFIVRVFGRIGT